MNSRYVGTYEITPALYETDLFLTITSMLSHVLIKNIIDTDCCKKYQTNYHNKT